MKNLSELLLIALVLSAGARAQDRPPRKVAPPRWPHLERGQRTILERELKALRQPGENAEQERPAHRNAIAALGAAAAPRLLALLRASRDEDLGTTWSELLDRITTRKQGALIAAELKSRAWQVRRWAARRLIALDYAPALAAIRAALKKEKEPLLRTTYQIALVRFGDPAGLDAIERAALENWPRWRALAHPALERMRGKAVTVRAVKLLRAADRRSQLAGLHLLAGGGDRSALALVRGHLGDSDRQMQEAAVNAMRGIVDGAPPRYDMPVFELIELARKWRGRR